MAKKPYAIIIMDGYGIAPAGAGNAIELDGSKNVHELMKNYPSATLGASGLSVGLPDGQMGNSEVGHLNMGAGRIVYQDLTKITKEIEDGDFFKNPVLVKAMENAKGEGKKLHLYGLLSDGGVHSHITHLLPCLKWQRGTDLKKFTCTASPTAGTFRPRRARALCANCRRRLTKSAAAR